MRKIYELDYTKLKNVCSPSDFNFQSTAELTPLEGIIGQERAVKAFEFGLAVKMKGYNIYMCGPSGTGKTTYALNSTQKLALTEPVPMDWCYVYNFENPMKPMAISFEAGIGKRFVDDMAELVAQFRKELSKAFRSEDYEKEKLMIAHSFEEQQDEMFEEMSVLADEYDFMLKSMESGIYFIPIVNGEPVENENYDLLSEDEKAAIDKNNLLLREKTAPFMRKIYEFRKECDKQIDELNHKIANAAIGHYIEELKETYKTNERVVSYIVGVQKDVLEHLEEFMDEGESEEDALASLMPLFGKKQEEDVTQRYRVNLIVDNSQTQGAPVVVNFNPTYNNLMGEIEYDSEFGSLTTDFMKIKGGLFHQANGGYLIVQAHDILSAPHAWEALRSVIKTKEINIDTIRELQGSTATPVLKPEPIPIKFKVIMIGSEYFYNVLSEYDEEFDKFFKVRADFDYEMPRTDENMLKITRFIKGFVEREKTLEFDVSAICAIIEYSSRSASRQDKLSTRFNYLAEILVEAFTWAKLENATMITAKHVQEAIYEKEQRMKLYEEKLDEMLDEEVVMIDTQGSEIGQINGLAVLDMGSYAFGTPSRITATTYVGKSGIVNIEKEAHMSGHTHDKGVQIITGFLGQTYAQKFPMSLSCRVCFEQNYNGIDGDSASSTELYCIISSLSELPIRQNLAVTGSVNQRGEIQAIGGVTQKIEGFFKLCKKRGLTGNQGVIIPFSNIKELVLNDEVIDAVKDGVFHIYPIKHIDEGIELLMDCPAGEKDEQGKFPLESVHGRVYAKLETFAKLSKIES
ncbi:MAG: AAA family ATPase [Lachnospiraceae bacterium]|nr:AAA family ATPase [Lachnospiraceae bacterium]